MRTQIWRSAHRAKLVSRPNCNARILATDSRNRLSKFWAPTGGLTPEDGEADESHALLLRGGFLRQAHSGIFHLLPLGLRVQNKLEALIDKHMSSIGASKVSLSHVSTEDLWKQTGRYSENSELLRIKDRKDSGFLLAPTHEEEITALIASMVHSYKDLPLRLYQTGRKYRDEKRPRQGLLRAKEFMMKDLYTFDASKETALATYEEVRQAYTNIFDDLKLPYLVADADSGNMGGKLSHEYHYASPKGEDTIWSCDSCAYVANEELVTKKVPQLAIGEYRRVDGQYRAPLIFKGITLDRKAWIDIVALRPEAMPEDEVVGWDDVGTYIDLAAVKREMPTLDIDVSASELSALLPGATFRYDAVGFMDGEVYVQKDMTPPQIPPEDMKYHKQELESFKGFRDRVREQRADIIRIQMELTREEKKDSKVVEGDACPRCDNGTLSSQKAIEVGHTFHLGTRYSEPLSALIAVPDSNEKQPIYMGCHGIGVSRLVGSIAGLLADERGLNWPRAVAPFEVIVVNTPQVEQQESEAVYDALSQEGVDAVLDDRGKPLGWKLKDADLIGYPIIVILGKAWQENRGVEVQCRRLGVKKVVQEGELKAEVEALLAQL